MLFCRKNSHPAAFLLTITLTFQFIFHSQVIRANSIMQTASLAANQGLIIQMYTNYNQFKSSSAGDFNGDGFGDIILTNYPLSVQPYFTGGGYVYIIFGSATGIPNVIPSIDNLVTPSQGIIITGSQAYAELGYSVSSLGDINQDGVDDIILGSPSAKSAYILFGNQDGGLSDLALRNSLPLSRGITLADVSPGQFGTAVNSAGDFNGDGINDFMVSDPIQNIVYVIFGKSSIASNFAISTGLQPQDGFRIFSSGSLSLGQSLSKAGDFNKDGIDDIMIAAPGLTCGGTVCGGVIIIYGIKSSSIFDIQIETMSPSQGVRITGTTSSQIPLALSPIGDFNNDGVDDIAIGTADYGTTFPQSGLTYVVYGKTGGFAGYIDVLSSFNGFQIQDEPQTYRAFGTSVASADVNGDGFSDLILGSPGIYWDLNDAGRTYVLFGNKDGYSNIDLTNIGPQLPQVLKIVGDTTSSELGFVTSSAKDLNNDGVDDMIIMGSINAYILYGNKCEGITQCSSTSLSPVCYASKGCACGESTGLNRYFLESKCVAGCPDQGYYLNNPICEPCPDSCLTCTSASICQACKESFVLKGTSCESYCPPGYTFNEGDCQSNDVASLNQAKAISSITDATHTADSASLTAASVLAPNDPGSVTASMLSKMLQYIKYMNVSYSQRLELTFKYQNSIAGPFGIGPKMPESIALNIPLHTIPYRFLKYHVHSSFIINFWDSLIFLAIIFGVLLVAVLLEWSLFMIKHQSIPIIRLIRATLQNFCLMQFYNIFGDVILFVILDLRIVNLVSTDAAISFCLSILFILTGCLLLARHIYILVRLTKLRKNSAWIVLFEEFSKQYQGSSVLFEHFKDDAFGNQSFLLFFVLRSCIFSLILALLSGQPILQAILISTLSIFMLFYLLSQRPFKSIINLLQHIICEVMMFIVNLCVLIMSQINFENGGAYQLRDRLCEAVIYTSLVFSFVPQTFLAIKIVVAVILWYKNFRKKKYSQQQFKERSELKIKNNLQKERVSSLQYQNESLNESSVGLNIVKNISSQSSQVNNSSSLANSTDQMGPLTKIKRTKFLFRNDSQIKKMESAFTVLKRLKNPHLFRFNQELTSQSSNILEPQEMKNMTKGVNEIDKQSDVSQDNQLASSFLRNMPINDRRNTEEL